MVPTTDEDNRDRLEGIRRSLNQNQREMAELMGLPLRTYEDLEAGRSEVRPVHLNAARYAAVQLAAQRAPNAAWPVEVSDAVAIAYEHLFGSRED